MNEIELPTRYLGAIVGAGYLLPVDPSESQLVVYKRMLEAADAGDGTAQAIILAQSFFSSQWHQLHLREKTGVNAVVYASGIELSHGHWPPSFRGSALQQLQKRAQEGVFIAAHLLAHIARQRMLDPDFKITDTR